MSEKILRGLIKFGEFEYMEKLLKYGELYLRNIMEFKRSDDGNLRGDNFEGVLTIKQIPKNYIYKYGGKRVGNITTGQFKEEAKLMISVYCMFGADHETIINNILHIPRRNFEFGDACVFIHDVREFAKRCKAVLGGKFEKYVFDKVKYYDHNTFEGEVNPIPFRKRNIYDYQNEYRIAIATGHLDNVLIRIGSIEDIAKLYSLEELESKSDLFLF